MRHCQHLHTCSYTSLRRDTHSQSEACKLTPLRTHNPTPVHYLWKLHTHTQTHRGWKESGKVYFPGFSCCCHNGFLYVLLHWIHVLLNTVFSCRSQTQANKYHRGVFNEAYSRERGTSAGKTDRLPKRAFIFCLSSRVMRTHASDRVSFTIYKRKGGRKKGRFLWNSSLIFSVIGKAYRASKDRSEKRWVNKSYLFENEIQD